MSTDRTRAFSYMAAVSFSEEDPMPQRSRMYFYPDEVGTLLPGKCVAVTVEVVDLPDEGSAS